MLFSPIFADKLREYVVEYQICLSLKKTSSASKNFCRVLDIRVSEIVIPDLPHPLRLEQLRKALCDVVRLD